MSRSPFGRGDRGAALVVLVAAAGALAGCLVGGAAGTWLLALSTATLPPALFRLAGGPRGMPPGVVPALFACLACGLIAMILPSLGSAGGRMWYGLPPSTWAVLLFLGAAPLLLVSAAYAAWFDRRDGDRE